MFGEVTEEFRPLGVMARLVAPWAEQVVEFVAVVREIGLPLGGVMLPHSPGLVGTIANERRRDGGGAIEMPLVAGRLVRREQRLARVHVRVLSAVPVMRAPVAGRRVGVEAVLGFEELLVQHSKRALQLRFRVGQADLARARGRENGERVAVAVTRVVLGFASRQEPVVALVLLVPLDVPEELEAVFGGRAAVRRPVDRDADREVVDRPAGRDEVFRSTVVHVAVALVELCHVPPEPSVHDVGPVELKQATRSGTEQLRVPARDRHGSTSGGPTISATSSEGLPFTPRERYWYGRETGRHEIERVVDTSLAPCLWVVGCHDSVLRMATRNLALETPR